jgi:hypothetical protein
MKAMSLSAPFLMHTYSPKLLKGIGLNLVLQGGRCSIRYDIFFTAIGFPPGGNTQMFEEFNPVQTKSVHVQFLASHLLIKMSPYLSFKINKMLITGKTSENK